jgi:hypothetical protein
MIPKAQIIPAGLCLLAAAQSIFAATPAISVQFFVTTDCPISNSYAPEIQRICAEYGPKGVSCELVYVDPTLSEADVQKHVKDFGYTNMRVVRDATQTVVKAAGATITPEAAIIGPAGAVLYRGRIDNVYAALGKRRPEATEHDLRRALDEVLAGKSVSEPRSQAIGCYIPSVGVK